MGLKSFCAILLCLAPAAAQNSGVLGVAPSARLVAKRNSTVEAKVESVAVTYPKPHMEKYRFSPKPLSVFTGDFSILTRFKVAADAPRGMDVIVGKIRYQACNDKACFPPKTLEIGLPVDVR
jgi:hypothetical protein